MGPDGFVTIGGGKCSSRYAALVLASERFARKIGRRPAARLLGWGHVTDQLPLERKDAPYFNIARRAAAQAYAAAGLTPADVHGAEVHDCFSISEIILSSHSRPEKLDTIVRNE